MATATKNDRRTDRVVVTNRRALHDYHISESIETGIVLSGTEIKSLRAGQMSIAEAYVRVDRGELWLIGSHISPYAFGTHANHDPHRPRKLLAHKKANRRAQGGNRAKGHDAHSAADRHSQRARQRWTSESPAPRSSTTSARPKPSETRSATSSDPWSTAGNSTYSIICARISSGRNRGCLVSTGFDVR